MLDTLIASFEGNIRQFDLAEFWLGLIVVSALALWAFFSMLRFYRYAHTIAIVPTAKIRSAAQGYVELNGKARLMDGPLIVSPLTGKICVWYHYKIEEQVRQYDSKAFSKTHWRVVTERASEDLFLLEDDTGRCVIDPDNADVITRDKQIWYKHTVRPPRRYTEQLITEHEPLYAIGLFKTLGNVDSKDFKQHVSHLLRQWKNDPNQLIHEFDSDGDRKLSESEWEQARLKAERHIRREHGQREKLEQLNVLKSSPHKDQAFILSTIAETTLIKRYYHKALASMIGFIISSGLVVWATTVRFGM
ncbi:MAG: hypothetical protein P1P93_04645 [Gammaproteobacteria bacterium]|nr:hypothetical protein [Gammaproteobacteria bacterium]